MPPATVGNARRLDRIDTVCSLGRAWRNCLASYGSAIDAGSCAVYLWEDAERPAACLINRHGRLGWLLDEVKGPRNSEVEPHSLHLSAEHLPMSASHRAKSCAPSRTSSTKIAALCARWTKIDDRRAPESSKRLLSMPSSLAGDPVGSGLVATLARPGGNVTGISSHKKEKPRPANARGLRWIP
jgi:hypothetical protein